MEPSSAFALYKYSQKITKAFRFHFSREDVCFGPHDVAEEPRSDKAFAGTADNRKSGEDSSEKMFCILRPLYDFISGTKMIAFGGKSPGEIYRWSVNSTRLIKTHRKHYIKASKQLKIIPVFGSGVCVAVIIIILILVTAFSFEELSCMKSMAMLVHFALLLFACSVVRIEGRGTIEVGNVKGLLFAMLLFFHF